MATKKVSVHAAKKNPKGGAQRKTTFRTKSSRGSSSLNGPSLERAAKRADVAVRRVGRLYVQKATELEIAQVTQRLAARQLAAFYADAAAEQEKQFHNFLAQGDSWFSYTCGFALIHWLQARFGSKNAYFDNIAASGRTLRQMLSREFRDELAAGPPDGKPWTAVLLSGGGNDICGDHRFRDWLNPYDGEGRQPDDYIADAFGRELDTLQQIYEEAIALVGKVAPGVRIFAHDYDFAIPDGRCVAGRSPRLRADFHLCFAGPWMRPAFDYRGFHKPGEPASQLTKDIVTTILKRFSERLANLERTYPNQFVLVRTQGTLTPIQDRELWDNELHPYDRSFNLLAIRLYEKLRSYL